MREFLDKLVRLGRNISNDIGSVTYVLIHTATGGKPPNREVWENPREQRKDGSHVFLRHG